MRSDYSNFCFEITSALTSFLSHFKFQLPVLSFDGVGESTQTRTVARYAYYQKVAPAGRASEAASPAGQPLLDLAPSRAATASHVCDGRQHCFPMTSCAEATYFLKNCPGTKMDGDHDGVPCEDQLCR